MGKEAFAFCVVGLALLVWYSQIMSKNGSFIVFGFGLFFLVVGLIDVYLSYFHPSNK